MKALFCGLVLLSLVSGCADDPTGPGAAPPPFTGDAAPSDWLEVTGSVSLMGLPETALGKVSQEQSAEWGLEALGFADHALGSTDDWRTAEANAAQVIASRDAAENPLIERYLTVALLRAHLFRTDAPEALPLVQKYTERLIEMESEETETMAAGLERLRGHIADETMEDLASRAVEVGERWTAACGNCDDNVRGTVDENRKPVAPVRFDRSASMTSLRTMAVSAD